MLQQTQVSTVIPYFQEWMRKFPSVQALATASLDEVIKAWEGLGYYKRAKDLHKTAQILLLEYNGELPQTVEALKKLPGIGSYTAGAIVNFAFYKKAPAVDGNTIRVLSRFFGLESTNRKSYEAFLLSILPETEPWLVTEGLIELGALVCKKIPKCDNCPLKEKCHAYHEKKIPFLPVKKKRPSLISLHRNVAVIQWRDEVLVGQVREGEVMAGLYEFPHAPLKEPFFICLNFGLSLRQVTPLPIVHHTFTRYKATLYPMLYKSEKKIEIEKFKWKKQVELPSLPFSAGHRKILEALKVEYFTH